MDENKYECYVTHNKEVILQPTKSTPPIVFAYIKTRSFDALKEILAEIKQTGIDMFRLDAFEWKTDSPIGSKFSEEES